MNFDTKDFYGDKHRWFIARVVNNRDPDRMNRVQIRIRGVHSENQIDVPQSSLPWAHTALPTTEGGTSGIGRISQIQPNAVVYGVFLDGQTSQFPLVIGVLTQFERPSEVQSRAAGGQGAAISNSRVGSDGVVIPPGVNTVDTESTQGARRGAGGGDRSRAGLNEKRFIGMQFFVSNGYTPAQAAGLMGNFEAESNLDTTVVSEIYDETGTRTSERSQGIAQWNPAAGRLQELFAFANSIRRPWDDYQTQLRFVIHELRGTHAWVQSRLDRCITYQGGINDTNATWVVLRYYENPASPRTKIQTRERLARTAYNQFVSGIGE